MSNSHHDKHTDETGKGVSRRALIGAAGSVGLAAAALTAGVPRPAEAQSLEGCFFALEIPEFFSGVFHEVSGIGSETLIREGGRARLNWSPIELKRGITSSMEIYDWRKMVEAGQVDEARKSGSIVAYDQTHAEIARWNFENAWPNKVQWSGFDSGQNQAAAPVCAWEALTLTVESLTRVR